MFHFVLILFQCPKTCIYIPNFITSQEEANILNQVNNAPKPKWDQLSNRRLLNYGGVPHVKGMIAEKMPPWLENYVEKVNNLGLCFLFAVISKIFLKSFFACRYFRYKKSQSCFGQ